PRQGVTCRAWAPSFSGAVPDCRLELPTDPNANLASQQCRTGKVHDPLFVSAVVNWLQCGARRLRLFGRGLLGPARGPLHLCVEVDLRAKPERDGILRREVGRV